MAEVITCKSCNNANDQGEFVADLCWPCHRVREMMKLPPSESFICCRCGQEEMRYVWGTPPRDNFLCGRCQLREGIRFAPRDMAPKKCALCGEPGLTYGNMGTYCRPCFDNAAGVSVAGAIGEDMVNHPAHYTQGKTETIDLIEETVQDPISFNHGNALKYLCRWRHKGNEVEDLKKCRWYIDRILGILEGAADV